MNGADVVAEARTWLGTPYQHQASLKGIACDCAGLILGIARALELLPDKDFRAPEFAGYGREPSPLMMLKACDRFLDRTARFGLGDVLVMRFEKDPQHLAIVSQVDPFYIIHSHAMVFKVTEHRLDEKWASRLVRAYRFRGVE